MTGPLEGREFLRDHEDLKRDYRELAAKHTELVTAADALASDVVNKLEPQGEDFYDETIALSEKLRAVLRGEAPTGMPGMVKPPSIEETKERLKNNPELEAQLKRVVESMEKGKKEFDPEAAAAFIMGVGVAPEMLDRDELVAKVHSLNGTIKSYSDQLFKARAEVTKLEREVKTATKRARKTFFDYIADAYFDEDGGLKFNPNEEQDKAHNVQMIEMIRKLKEEKAELEASIRGEGPEGFKGDGTDILCETLYGRKAEPKDYLGGSEAKMLYDAATEVKKLRSVLDAEAESDDGYNGKTWCGVCHAPMQVIRPGKHQCDFCEERDFALDLLKQCISPVRYAHQCAGRAFRAMMEPEEIEQEEKAKKELGELLRQLKQYTEEDHDETDSRDSGSGEAVSGQEGP